MKIDVLTLFPEMFDGVFHSSILGKAAEKEIVKLNAINFRPYAGNKHGTVDDTPYGGGGGMVLKPDPIFAAVEDILSRTELPEGQDSPQANADAFMEPGEQKRPRIILMCPQGETFTQSKAEELSQEEHLIFICGHYEGYDERIREHLVTDELSIGDYVLTGGELPAMVIIDSVVRLLPGVLGNETSAVTDSFSTGLLEYPHYTRPAEFRGWKVPDILLSGHHANIDQWRREQALLRTWQRRPELLERLELSKKDQAFLDKLRSKAEAPTES
ncbi:MULTISPECIES: tRNA (guanosine(37)-N1)-methyltransferase TrmD [Paenibacillus]|uniref:tRNA (guanine-N(1)-)-methyltransferase n=2 Tax=Paenibacillus lactis TaxID=228574 RepID=G4HLS7_9BACL|nr:tRNA (guanosine(37)-N1)-methyltransferase TrmD [Paenibacillus lactis]EHB56572.1 tRNA (guanine-N1)-methyltransferase [Paenibacillus lactis 154]MBP1893150.1 tRNA (guanine37-N1)-methyltransferase [Paenibacillus lactis]MCM3496527.1 tRNA (guanosine(37)-N1)-methyltransferase TrmD [Paenibacillus lactis]GIO94475.1 tRNA (guanine-N(1)-)-methyltransferase [Paenibacillus lactis]HAG01674.1 tRNA (guanosine(37)-N1)-methyltransferase TrmD [Paenibacillus lactis]